MTGIYVAMGVLYAVVLVSTIIYLAKHKRHEEEP